MVIAQHGVVGLLRDDANGGLDQVGRTRKRRFAHWAQVGCRLSCLLVLCMNLRWKRLNSGRHMMKEWRRMECVFWWYPSYPSLTLWGRGCYAFIFWPFQLIAACLCSLRLLALTNPVSFSMQSFECIFSFLTTHNKKLRKFSRNFSKVWARHPSATPCIPRQVPHHSLLRSFCLTISILGSTCSQKLGFGC